MRCCTRFRSSLSGKAASVYILSLYSRAGSCSTASVVNIDFGQRPIGVSTDLRRRVLHRVRRVFHPPLPRAARVGTGWASAAFNFALRSFVNAACSLHGRGRAPRLPRPARCRSCRPPSDSARCRVPARFSSLVCCRCAGSRSRARYSSILTRAFLGSLFRPNVPSRCAALFRRLLSDGWGRRARARDDVSVSGQGRDSRRKGRPRRAEARRVFSASIIGEF